MKVLIAEDEPVFRHMLESMLNKWGYEVIVAKDGQQAWDALQQDEAPRLAILDWMMPKIEGVEVARRARHLDRKDYTYVILLTAKDCQEDIIAGMEAGADDYVVKPFDAAELKARLRAAARILSLQAELLTAQEALREQAMRDGLTGLWNRSEVVQILQEELQRGERQGGCVSVIVVDIDRFKEVNDTHGHVAGDAVLRKVAAAMGGAIRSCDQLGRYGGEEFLVVAPACDLNDGMSLAERLRAAVEACVVDTEGKELTVTISLGVAVHTDTANDDPDALIRLADMAMYQAKQHGRNRVESAAPACAEAGAHE